MGGGAWPSLVRELICLVNSVNERDFDLLTRHHSYAMAVLLRGTLRV
jgi:hypothetical protein